MLFSIENIQLKRIQDRILEILVTALLESIDFLLQFLMCLITKYGSGILVCPGETHFDPDKKVTQMTRIIRMTRPGCSTVKSPCKRSNSILV